jgi:hypothetical protein
MAIPGNNAARGGDQAQWFMESVEMTEVVWPVRSGDKWPNIGA